MSQITLNINKDLTDAQILALTNQDQRTWFVASDAPYNVYYVDGNGDPQPFSTGGGAGGIYSGSDTVPTNVEATLTDELAFIGGDVYFESVSDDALVRIQPGGKSWFTNDLGVGHNDPSTPLHVQDTATQFRIGYDPSNFADFTVESDGSLNIEPTNYVLRLGDFDTNNNGTHIEIEDISEHIFIEADTIDVDGRIEFGTFTSSTDVNMITNNLAVFTNTTSPRTLTLPTSPGVGTIIWAIVQDATNPVTVVRPVGDTINGLAADFELPAADDITAHIVRGSGGDWTVTYSRSSYSGIVTGKLQLQD